MEDIKDIKNIINKIGKNVAKTSKDIIKNTKLSINLSSQEEKLKNLYIEVGKKVYEIYSYGGNIGEFFDIKYKEMLSVQKEIEAIKNKIEENKNNDISSNDNTIIDKRNNNINDDYKICVSCGEKNNIENNFCLKCGKFL